MRAFRGSDQARPVAPVLDDSIVLYKPRSSERRLSDRAAKVIGFAAVFCVAVVVCTGFALSALLDRRPAVDETVATATVTGSRLVRTKAVAPTPLTGAKPIFARSVAYRQQFSNLGSDPSQVCQALGAADVIVSDWQPGEVAGNGWECTASLAGEGPDTGLFLLLRGQTADRIDRLLLKVNLGDPQISGAVRQAVLGLAERLEPFIDIALPPVVATALADGRPTSLSIQSARFSLEEEFNQTGRFYLVARYGELAQVLSKQAAGAGQTAPWSRLVK